MDKFIEINNIFFKYNKGQNIFNDFSLKLDCRENTMLIGHNGSGKTTLSKLIMGINKPQKGEINIFGQSSYKMTLGQVGGLVGYVFQYPERQLFARSVMDELTFPLIIKGISEDEANNQAEELLSIFELQNVRNSHPFYLSYGEKRRLAIASVLMNKPKYLILDEPTASLDRERIDSLSDVLYRLKERDLNILAISHNKDFINKHGERIIKLEGGKIVSDIRTETGS